MSLRYRLFLWVSGLFILISICAYFIENHVTLHELGKAKESLRKEVLAGSEKRRIDLQNFLMSTIAENAVQIDAILNNISNFSPQALRFGPTPGNEQKGTWGDCADLLLENKGLDFIQNTSQGKLLAALIPEQRVIASSYRVQIDEDLAWAYCGEKAEPYFAVRVPYSLVVHKPGIGDEMLEQVSGAVPEAYLLFDLEGMRSAKSGQPIFEAGGLVFPPIPVKWTEGYELDMEPFVKAFQRGRELLLANKITPPQYSLQELKEKIASAAAGQDGVLNAARLNLLKPDASRDQVMEQRVQEAALRYTQITMIWVMVALFDSGLFGKDPLSFPAPLASAVYTMRNAVGVGIEAKDVLFSNRLFDDSAYYAAHASQDSNLAQSIAIIPSPAVKGVFLGNTAQFVVRAPHEEKKGYLTLGVDSDFILQRLAAAVQRTTVLVHQGKAYTAFGEGGEKLDVATDLSLPFAEMLQKNTGSIPWRGEGYFYVSVQPFPDVDLYFFLLNPEAKEFAMLRDLDAGSKRVIDAIRLSTHIFGLVALGVAILLLHNIARNITKPITQLADATKDVAEGHLEKVKASLPLPKHRDEIAVLCHSFDEMVTGLQEKEKVKGVLNKVVSQEIAQEILKGSVHLGGEEKLVSVLFADIRGFTSMTQSMPPQKVIELLNTCMTKVSQVIDRNRGVIDKYVGDEAMALFGAPVHSDEDAFNAVKSALEMVKAMKTWNEERSRKSEPPIELGIGIHTGAMLAGNMGAENRLNYTVIGSNVNLAFRICSAAKKMEILITKDTLNAPFVKERFHFEELPPAHVKGFDNSVEVFRILEIKE